MGNAVGSRARLGVRRFLVRCAGGRVGVVRFAGPSAYTLRAPRLRASRHGRHDTRGSLATRWGPAARTAPTLPATNRLLPVRAVGRSSAARLRCPSQSLANAAVRARAEQAPERARATRAPKRARAIHAPNSSEGLGTGARPLARSKRPALCNGAAWQRTGSAGLAACKRLGADGRAQSRATFAHRQNARAGRARWSLHTQSEYAR